MTRPTDQGGAVSPTALQPSAPRSASKLWSCLAMAVLGVVALVYLLRFDANSGGYAGWLHFGQTHASGRIPGLRGQALGERRGDGYDGQFYAQMAVRLDPRDPVLAGAMDNPAYRYRRVGMPGLAHWLGSGFLRPIEVVNLFALLHVAAWLGFGFVLMAWIQVEDLESWLRWVVCVLGLGALESLRLALPDVPSLALGLFGLWWLGQKRPAPACLNLGLGLLCRETLLLCVPGFLTLRGRRVTGGLLVLLAVVPLVGWILWISTTAPSGSTGLAGNFDWPGLALWHHLSACVHAICSGAPRWRDLFGLVGAAGLAFQSLWLLSRWRNEDPLLRFGLATALLFWFLGPLVWQGYWAVARSCLPMTVVFCVRFPRGRWSIVMLLLTNLSLLHGVMRFWLNA